MNLEQLQLIMNTLSQMGEQGKEAFIWWLVLDKALPYLAWLIILPMVLYAVFRLARLITKASDSQDWLRQLDQEIRPAKYAVWTDSRDVMAMLEEIRKLKSK